MTKHATLVRGRTKPVRFELFDKRAKPVDLTAATVTLSMFRPEGNFAGDTMRWPILMELCRPEFTGATLVVLDQGEFPGIVAWDPLDDGLGNAPLGTIETLKPGLYFPQFRVVFFDATSDFAPFVFGDLQLEVGPRWA